MNECNQNYNNQNYNNQNYNNQNYNNQNYSNYSQSWQAPQPPCEQPNNHIGRGVVGCFFGIVPLSVVGIVFGAIAETKWKNGQYDDALDFYEKADRFTKLSLRIGIPILVGIILLYTIIIMAAALA